MDRHGRRCPPRARARLTSRPAPAPSAPAGPSKPSRRDALGRSHRAKLGKARLKQAIDLTREVLRGAGRLPHRHRARLRHRRGRDGPVVAARRRGRSTCWPGKASARAGSPTSVKQLKLEGCPRHHGAPTASCPTSPRSTRDARRRVHLERHHLGRARAERRLDRRRPRGPDDLRRHLGGLRPGARLREARCRHLLLAEGARRRGGARHADPVAARGRAARELHAALAAAEDLPPDQGRQADRGHLRGRDHQHALACSCVEDYLDALEWAAGDRRPRGARRARPTPTPRCSHDWVARTPWIANLAKDPATPSNTRVCL